MSLNFKAPSLPAMMVSHGEYDLKYFWLGCYTIWKYI